MEARRPPKACPPAPIWKPTGCHLQDGTNNRFFIDKGLDSQPWKSSPQFSYSKSDSFSQTVLYRLVNTEGTTDEAAYQLSLRHGKSGR